MTDVPTRADVEAVLDGITDPCSAALGRPIGLVGMGLVRDVAIDAGADGVRVAVALTTTDPLCMVAPAFIDSVYRRVGAMAGVLDVTVRLDHGIWTEADLEPEAREGLVAARLRRQGRSVIPWLATQRRA